MTVLTYSIAREWLQGNVGGEAFSMHAWAGGARGRTGSGAQHDAASYGVYRKTNHAKGVHGGPLPPGLYLCHYVAHHPHFGECLSLEQTVTALFELDGKSKPHFYNRSAFFIHGRGPHGSDGCIVPESESERTRLNRAVRNSADTILLKVTEPGIRLPATGSDAIRFA